MKRCLKHAILAIFAALFFSATTVYASGVLDVNYLNCLRPYAWDSVPSNTFEDSGVSGTYKILLDKETGCFYLAVFIYEPSAVIGADESDARITVDIESPAFTEKRFEFVNGEQPEEETPYHVITKSSAEFSQMDNAGQNVISGYVYAGFYFEKETERTAISVTANYSCGDTSKCIFKDVLLDMTCDSDLTETQTVVQTQTVHHTDSSNYAGYNDKSAALEKSSDKDTEETKYSGKAAISTTESAKSTKAEDTKFSATAGSVETTSSKTATESAVNADTSVQNSAGLSNSSIALLCTASVLCTGGIGAVAAGITAQAKKSAAKGDDKNE